MMADTADRSVLLIDIDGQHSIAFQEYPVIDLDEFPSDNESNASGGGRRDAAPDDRFYLQVDDHIYMHVDDNIYMHVDNAEPNNVDAQPPAVDQNVLTIDLSASDNDDDDDDDDDVDDDEVYEIADNDEFDEDEVVSIDDDYDDDDEDDDDEEDDEDDTQTFRIDAPDPPAYVPVENLVEFPREYVILLLTGPPPSTRPPNTPRTLKMAMIKRLPPSEHVLTFTSNLPSTSNQSFMAHMTQFIYLNGVSQKMKIKQRNKKYASFETRVKSFGRCKKSLLQTVPALCESGLYYKGTGHNDDMVCYCCGIHFKRWQYLVNPWVQHAIRSPNCTLLLISKGRQFVVEVHEAYNLIKTCNKWLYQELFYGHFSRYDLGFMDISAAEGDEAGRNKCIDQLVSAKMLRMAPYHLLPYNCNEAKKPPIPNEITCKICYKEKIEILFVPCGHVFACIQCAVTLHECAICREPFSTTSYALKISMEEELYYDAHAPPSPVVDTSLDNLNSNALCRVCKIESIATAFVPCLHVYTCYQCAITADSCPVCSKDFFGIIQVFL